MLQRVLCLNASASSQTPNGLLHHVVPGVTGPALRNFLGRNPEHNAVEASQVFSLLLPHADRDSQEGTEPMMAALPLS